MGKNDKTSPKMLKTAAVAFRTGKATPKQIRQMGASLVNQAANKKKK